DQRIFSASVSGRPRVLRAWAWAFSREAYRALTSTVCMGGKIAYSQQRTANRFLRHLRCGLLPCVSCSLLAVRCRLPSAEQRQILPVPLFLQLLLGNESQRR